MQKHILPTDTINKVLNYLASQKYSDVWHLIDEVRQKSEPFVEKIEKALPEAEKPHSVLKPMAEAVNPLPTLQKPIADLPKVIDVKIMEKSLQK